MTAHGPAPVAMIFEFWFDPATPEVYDEYLRESEQVRRALADRDGFLGVERFQSTTDPQKFLALGFFRDEAAVTRWRNDRSHRRVQALGRHHLFSDYRLRMAHIVRDYGPAERNLAPADSRVAHDPRGESR